MRKLLLIVSTLVILATSVPNASAGHTADTRPAGGVNTHLSYFWTPYGDADLTASGVSVAEAKWVRDAIPPYQGDSWNARMYDAFRKVHAKNGAYFVATMVRADQSVKDQLDTIAPMVNEGIVRVVEGANEWDNKGRTNWAAEVKAHQCELYKQVKARWPKVTVIAPSFVKKPSYKEIGPLTDCVDYSNLHYYALQSGFDVRDLDERVVLAKYVGGEKPLVVTEANAIYGEPRGGTEQGQADWAKYLFDLLGDRGAFRIFVYELFNESSIQLSLSHEENNYGLYKRIDGKWYVKPVFYPARELNRRG